MAVEGDVQSELEVLQSIYLDELTVTRNDEGGRTVSVVLHPSTGEDSLAQFVCLTLTLDLNTEYPASPPSISIHHPRGLSDDKLLSLQLSLSSEAEECVGTSVLYQLIEKAKEILTESNIPHGSCVICLYHFQEGEVFTKTSCYHYFHSHCLGRYVTHSEEELQERVRELEEDKTRERGEAEVLCVVCPVCREPLSYDANVLMSSPPPNFPPQEDESVSAEFKRRWAELQQILDAQRERGGVIDPEAESNRFLVHINDAPADAPSPTATDTTHPSALPPEPSNQNPHPPGVNESNASRYRTPRTPHFRTQQTEFRGGRRDRGQGGHLVPSPMLEKLGKLSVSSAVDSRNVGAPHDPSEHRDGHFVNYEQRRESGDNSVRTNHQETPESKHQHTTSNTAYTSATQRGTRRDRGKRYGPRGPTSNHWHERNAQWDTGGNLLLFHHRGARGHREGHHRGNTKSWHQRTESELRKEGVL